MEFIYFIHGFFVGVFRLLIGAFEVCFLYGEIASERKCFVTEIDPLEIEAEIDRRLDEWED
jgi:hypothetical protein